MLLTYPLWALAAALAVLVVAPDWSDQISEDFYWAGILSFHPVVLGGLIATGLAEIALVVVGPGYLQRADRSLYSLWVLGGILVLVVGVLSSNVVLGVASTLHICAGLALLTGSRRRWALGLPSA